MKEIAPRIVVDAKIRFGKPVIQGTRVPVETVLAHLGGGWDYGRVCEEFGLTPDDIRAALAYAAQVIQQEQTRAVG